ncbi:MAG: DNA topoisomerase I [Coriobacteriia bacterium]
MRLVVSEKNIAARRIAEILAVGKPSADKVYTIPVYRFRRDGEDWVAIGLKGHIMEVDFPEDFKVDGKTVETKRWNKESLRALVDAPIEKVDKEKQIIRALKNLAKKADSVVIATDYDREGELIGMDARSVIWEVAPDMEVSRARFSALTKEEVEKAFSALGSVSEELAEAGEARQDIDLVWGAVLTRYLTLAANKAANRKWGKVLSAGRVQTPTLKLIVDREREREEFVPEDYWVVKAAFSAADEEFQAGHRTARFKEEQAARAVLAAVEGNDSGTVVAVKRTKRSVRPPAPFNTTSLLAAAASEGIPPAQTMRIAEGLYMNGYISYPRVDNTVYPASLDIRHLLRNLSAVAAYREAANALLARSDLKPTRGKKETTDHPPIHPTGAADPDKLGPRDWKVYNLVARRFLATLSDPALIEATRVDIEVAGETFVAKGDVLVSPGFRAVYPYGMKKEEQLPPMNEGDQVVFVGAQVEAKQTQPPARFGQGKLIQEMEKLGLGTKATRHNTIQTLLEREYVQNDPLEPTCRGITVIEALSEYAPRITLPEMTAELEADMDAIAESRASRKEVVEHSRVLLGEVMDTLLERFDDVGALLKKAADEDAKLGACPKSGHDLLVKYSPKNKSYFVGCAGYPDCEVTYPLPKASGYERVEEPCPVCGTPQVQIRQFRQRPRVLCLDPECPTWDEPEVVVGKCPTGDGGDLVVRRSPSTLKRFVRCTNHPECKVSYPLPQWGDVAPTGETCEPCGSPKVTVETRRGPWTICIDPECPTKEKRQARGSGRSRRRKSAGSGGSKGSGGGEKSEKSEKES